jgi:hypothetical protein
MAIYGIGAHYGKTHDVSGDFIKKKLAGVGWPAVESPELHQFIASLAVGDIIYIKSFSPTSKFIFVLAVGFVRDDEILDAKSTHGLIQAGRNVVWKITERFSIPKPKERNNVRLNTLYQEFHPKVQAEIIKRLTA